MVNKYKVNDTAFIVVSNRVIREVSIVKCSGGFYTVKFVKGSGGIRLRENRLFATREEAESSIPKSEPMKPTPTKTGKHPTPWD